MGAGPLWRKGQVVRQDYPLADQRPGGFLQGLVLRGPLLPIWLPIVLWRRHRRNGDMAAFAVQRKTEGTGRPDEIALKWVAARLEVYILGKYDPAVPALTRTFPKILARRE